LVFSPRNRTATFTIVKEQAACQTNLFDLKEVFWVIFGVDGGDGGKICIYGVKITVNFYRFSRPVGAQRVKGGGVRCVDVGFDFVWRLCATRYEAVGFV
jgi:hypothetical protein